MASSILFLSGCFHGKLLDWKHEWIFQCSNGHLLTHSYDSLSFSDRQLLLGLRTYQSAALIERSTDWAFDSHDFLNLAFGLLLTQIMTSGNPLWKYLEDISLAKQGWQRSFFFSFGVVFLVHGHGIRLRFGPSTEYYGYRPIDTNRPGLDWKGRDSTFAHST